MQIYTGGATNGGANSAESEEPTSNRCIFLTDHANSKSNLRTVLSICLATCCIILDSMTSPRGEERRVSAARWRALRVGRSSTARRLHSFAHRPLDHPPAPSSQADARAYAFVIQFAREVSHSPHDALPSARHPPPPHALPSCTQNDTCARAPRCWSSCSCTCSITKFSHSRIALELRVDCSVRRRSSVRLSPAHRKLVRIGARLLLPLLGGIDPLPAACTLAHA
jgi:hypothetical protein